MEACGEEWKEWSSLKVLTERIPQQFQHGLNISPLSLTCLDAYHDHLAIGTNAGLVYLAHLPSFNIIKLKCENTSSCVESVAAVNSVDDMIAAGCRKGSITIFQIPPISSSNKLTASQGSNMFDSPVLPSSPQRFTLSIHKAPVTALIWSRNGMKLFSGDMEGNVGLVEVDYEKCECTGKCLFKVDSRVVQLSYTHQMLSVSYQERCLIYNFKDDSKNLVGKKPRNPPGLFGCAFALTSELPKRDILYCARPTQRIWSADTKGVVLFSYIQKKLPEHSMIKLSDIPKSPQRNTKFSFGFLYHYKGSTLVSYSGNCLIILNVSSQKVLGYCEDFRRICDVAVAGDDIFILDNNRNIICISPFEPSFGKSQLAALSMTNSLHLPSQENLNLTTLSEIKFKMMLPNKHLIDGIAKLSETVASKLSEIATPTIIPGDKNWNEEKDFSNYPMKIQTQIHMPKPYFLGMSSGAMFQSLQNLQPNENVVEGKSTPEVKEENRQTPETDEDGHSKEVVPITRERNYDVVLPSRGKRKIKKKTEPNSDPNRDKSYESEMKKFNDDARTYEDFKETIEENESLLADVLNLSCLRMDHENKANDEQLESNKIGNQSCPQSLPSCKEVPSHFAASNSLPSKPTGLDSRIFGQQQQQLIKDLSYGPPSGSSAINSFLEESLYNQPSTYFPGAVNTFREGIAVATSSIEGLTLQKVNTMPFPEELPWGWQKHHLPAKPQGFLARGNAIYISECRDLYFSHDLYPNNEGLPSWKRKRLLVEVSSFCSYDKNLLIQTKQGHLISLDWDKLLSSEPLHGNPVLEDKDIACAASDENVIWTLNENGKVVARLFSEENENEIEISCQELRLRSLVCRSGVVWGLTSNGRIAYRIGVRANVPVGIEWGIMLHPNKVKCIHLSENGLGWMMDSVGGLYVSLYVNQSYPQGLDGKWWQIGMSDYMLEEENQPNANTKEENQHILMTSNEHHLWVSQTDAPFAFTHSLRSFVGHRWERLESGPFLSISGEGIFKSFGNLYCLDTSGSLFAVSPHSDRTLPMELPNREKLTSISSRPESLWVLSKSGKIFIRTGLSSSSYLGSKWVRLDLQQIADIRLKHLSLSTEVVWAVDTKGQVYMRQGPLTPLNPQKKGLDPAWLRVDSNELKNGAIFEKVYVGNKSHLVWGIDSAHRIYVREAIFPEISTGTSWVLVPGILAQAISISEDSVFVLTPIRDDSSCDDSLSGKCTGGLLFERKGISPTNYIGDTWKRIPSHSTALRDITASVDNCLLALDKEGKILRHTSLPLFDVGLEGKFPEGDEEGGFTSSDLEEWEIL